MVVAANRKSAAARLDDLLVRDDNNLPPDILLPGARQSHEVKCLALFPRPQVRAAFGDQLQRQCRAKSVDLGKIGAQNAIKSGTHIERGHVDLRAFGPCLGQGRNVPIGLDGQCRDGHLQLAVSGFDLSLVDVVKLQGLGQGEDVFVPIIAGQGCLDYLD
jgi:hypothetical protein